MGSIKLSPRDRQEGEDSKDRDKFFYGLSLAGGLTILSSTMANKPMLPFLSKSLGADAGLLGGLVIAASTILGIFVSLPAGSLSDIVRPEEGHV